MCMSTLAMSDLSVCVVELHCSITDTAHSTEVTVVNIYIMHTTNYKCTQGTIVDVGNNGVGTCTLCTCSLASVK